MFIESRAIETRLYFSAVIESEANHIKYFIIDEVHLICSWGGMMRAKNEKIFRESFTEMRDLFVHFEVSDFDLTL